MKQVTLNNQYHIPILGLGTFRSKPEDAYNAVKVAIETGYTHIDTAAIYDNEEAVGKAIKDSGVNREDLFITTKVWNTDQGYDQTIKAFNTSLEKLGLEYVDLYLIHWFKGYELALDTYRALEDLYKQGKIKAIGVSNFNIHHLQYLLDYATIKPMVNQVETHIYLQNHFLQEFCEKNGIKLEAYAPFMSSHIKELLENEVMNQLAEKYQKTVTQINLRWFIQRGIIVIPKSITPSRIKENFDVFGFALDDSDMQRIRKLNKGQKFFPEFDHIDF